MKEFNVEEIQFETASALDTPRWSSIERRYPRGGPR